MFLCHVGGKRSCFIHSRHAWQRSSAVTAALTIHQYYCSLTAVCSLQRTNHFSFVFTVYQQKRAPKIEKEKTSDSSALIQRFLWQETQDVDVSWRRTQSTDCGRDASHWSLAQSAPGDRDLILFLPVDFSRAVGQQTDMLICKHCSQLTQVLYTHRATIPDSDSVWLFWWAR